MIFQKNLKASFTNVFLRIDLLMKKKRKNAVLSALEINIDYLMKKSGKLSCLASS